MFHEMWTAGIYEIIAAVSGATISGIILLQIHHSKVKQELKIHREKDVFERKQIMYRNLIDYFLEFDLKSNAIHEKGNWRIGNYIFTELILVGGESVITAVTTYLKSKLAGTDNAVEHTNKIKDILIGMRKDLYHHELKHIGKGNVIFHH